MIDLKSDPMTQGPVMNGNVARALSSTARDFWS